MTQASNRDPLLQTFKLKNMTLRNRIMSTSHASGAGDHNGMPGQRYQDYHVEKAKGGIGLTMFGGSSNISIDSPSVMPQLNMGVDEVIPYLQQFSSRVHAEGAAIMCQITHLGKRGEFNKGAFLPTIAPSVMRESLHRSIPKQMDHHDIKRVTDDYVKAALRCKEGGLDGLECLGMAHLIGQFLSPFQNKRSDEYGGSVENRCRFGLDVFEAIREAIGDKMALGFRFIVDEGYEEGLNFEESVEIARIFQAAGHIDYVNASYGRMDTYATIVTENMPGMETPDAPWLQKAAAFKREIDLPVIHAARISDVATARYAIKEGLIDLVGMTRAHFADPYIASKIAAGKEERIRPCVGATHCMSPMRPACIHNPATGHEGVLHHQISKADESRNVVVIGAGPAGLEAARVCGERGHNVTVFEAAPHAGGQVLLAAKSPWRTNLLGIVGWRVNELEALGIGIHYNTFVEPEHIQALNPDLVIVATGGIPNIDWVPGSEYITSPWDILDGTAKPASDVLVVDGTGRNTALSVAELCHNQSSKVRMAVIDDTIAAEQPYGQRVVWRKWVRDTGLSIQTEEALKAVRREGNKLIATLKSELTNAFSQVETDQVIFDYGTIPADEIYHGLRSLSTNDGVTQLDEWVLGYQSPKEAINADGKFELHRIGDAISSRDIHAAVNDALRLCQNC